MRGFVAALGLGFLITSAACGGGGGGGGGPTEPAATPTISAVSPNQGRPGDQITISGSNLGGAQASVAFRGASAQVTTASATSIVAVLPDIAPGAAAVSVTIGGRSASFSGFSVLNPPAAVLSVGGLYQTATTQTGACAIGPLVTQVYQLPLVVTHTPGSNRAQLKSQDIDAVVAVNLDGSFADVLLFNPPWIHTVTGNSLIGQFTVNGFAAQYVAHGWVPSLNTSCDVQLAVNAMRASGVNTFP